MEFAGAHAGFDEQGPFDVRERGVVERVEVVYDGGGPVGVDHVVPRALVLWDGRDVDYVGESRIYSNQGNIESTHQRHGVTPISSV